MSNGILVANGKAKTLNKVVEWLEGAKFRVNYATHNKDGTRSVFFKEEISPTEFERVCAVITQHNPRISVARIIRR
ncbi:MAG TPA: hypothetical protein VJL38_03315 [Patescibacteria group bacterium]|nr:hypothetical protein [Patescibacteria group bacterium]